jgi:hypothetical protein
MALLDPRRAANDLPLVHIPNEVSIADRILKETALKPHDDFNPQNTAVQIMEQEMGWGLKEDLEALRALSQYADKDDIKLKALTTALEIRKVIRNKDSENTNRSVTFVLQDSNVQLNNILNPQR